MDNNIIPIIAASWSTPIAVACSLIIRRQRAMSALAEWARHNGLTLVSASQTPRLGRPLGIGVRCSTYRIAVVDQSGQKITGVAHCGSCRSDSVDVVWD